MATTGVPAERARRPAPAPPDRLPGRAGAWASSSGRRVVAVLALIGVLAGCGGGDTASPTTAPAPSGPAAAADEATGETATGAAVAGPLGLTATRSTLFDTARTFRLEVTGGDEPVAITSLRLESPLFRPVPAVDRELVVGTGAHVLVPLAYGESVCDTIGEAALGEVVVGTDRGDLRVPLAEHPEDLVTGLQRRECAVATIRTAVDPRFSDDTQRTGPRAATLELVLTAPPDGSAELQGIDGNIIFGLTTETPLPLVVDDGTVAVPVRIAANRCDTHALIEAKRKYVLPVTLALDGGEPVVVDVTATGATEQLLQQLLAACLDLPD